MVRGNFDQDSKKDGLFITKNTTVDDIKAFLKERAESPIEIDGTVIYDFCGFERDEEALVESVTYHLRNDKYIIPFQVTGTWGYMYHLLPEELKDAEILVYDPSSSVYKGYTNYARELSSEQEDTFRQDLARRVADSEPVKIEE